MMKAKEREDRGISREQQEAEDAAIADEIRSPTRFHEKMTDWDNMSRSDRGDLKGTRLKMLCRMGCLPVVDRVGREVKEARTCLVCNRSQLEDVKHLLLECPAYAGHRARMVDGVRRMLCPVVFNAMDTTTRMSVLLGKRVGNPAIEDKIDRTVKRYLKKAWNARAVVREAINATLGTTYGVFSARAA